MIPIQLAVSFVFTLIIAGMVFWLLWWLVGYCQLPQPFDKVARVTLAVLAVFVLISILLHLIGRPVFIF